MRRTKASDVYRPSVRRPLAAGLLLLFAALQPAHAAQTGATGPQQAATLQPLLEVPLDNPEGAAGPPATAGTRLFYLTAFPHALHAVDLADHGREIWRYAPAADGRAGGLGCCDLNAAAPVVDGDAVLIVTLDGHVVSLDAATGAVRWDTSIADPARGEVLTQAPLVAEGKVVIGSAGDDNGARGFLVALDAENGREIWRKYTTGADADVGIGAGTRPFYSDDKGLDLGRSSWPPGGADHGGGGLAGPVVYDARQHLLIYATGHPAPWNPDQRPGANKWTSSVIARDLATGEMRWADQTNPHDLFGLGAGAAGVLVQRGEAGAPSLLVHADPNGQVYTIDTGTGRWISVVPFTTINATTGADPETGVLTRVDARAARVNVMTRDVCPGWPGALGGQPAVTPDQRLIVMPVSRLCMDMEARNVSYIAGTAYVGANLRAKAPPNGQRGAVVGWDIDAGRPAWTRDEAFPVIGGVAMSAAGTVFYGTLDGRLVGLDARDGRQVFERQLGAGVMRAPLVTSLPNGRAIVAVITGLAPPFALARPDADRRDATAMRGLANALNDLPDARGKTPTLDVFGVP